MPEVDAKGNVTLNQITIDAQTISGGNISQVIAEMGVVRNSAQEASYEKTIVTKITANAKVSDTVNAAILNFVTYGTKSTKVLGAGERAGVVDSYKSAFGKLPSAESEWNDVVKIANGRWPSARSESKENKAKTSFSTIYKRGANMSNPKDNAAVTVMAYGLRPAQRNTNSEKAAIQIFKNIFGYAPSSASNWDAVRAIAYSGATR